MIGIKGGFPIAPLNPFGRDCFLIAPDFSLGG